MEKPKHEISRNPSEVTAAGGQSGTQARRSELLAHTTLGCHPRKQTFLPAGCGLAVSLRKTPQDAVHDFLLCGGCVDGMEGTKDGLNPAPAPWSLWGRHHWLA